MIVYLTAKKCSEDEAHRLTHDSFEFRDINHGLSQYTKNHHLFDEVIPLNKTIQQVKVLIKYLK